MCVTANRTTNIHSPFYYLKISLPNCSDFLVVFNCLFHDTMLKDAQPSLCHTVSIVHLWHMHKIVYFWCCFLFLSIYLFGKMWWIIIESNHELDIFTIAIISDFDMRFVQFVIIFLFLLKTSLINHELNEIILFFSSSWSRFSWEKYIFFTQFNFSTLCHLMYSKFVAININNESFEFNFIYFLLLFGYYF